MINKKLMGLMIVVENENYIIICRITACYNNNFFKKKW
jgi:hypothetical protein